MPDNATKEYSIPVLEGPSFTFTPLAESHFPLLLKWLEAPHVKAWWPADRSFSVGGDHDVKWTPALIQEKYSDYVKGYKLDNGVAKTIKAYVICIDSVPIGYIQIYNAYDFARGEPLIDLPASLAAFDVFIGDESYLKQGVGSRAIAQFLKEHGTSYTHVFAEPKNTNIAAIRAYEKAGFRKCKKQPTIDEVWMILNNQVVSVNNVEHFVWGDICDGWWLKKDNNFTVIEEIMPPGGLEVKHFHNITEQFFYVLSGSLFIEMNNHEHQIKGNQGLTIPVGVAHQAFNKSKEEVRFLVISCPDSHSDRINVEDSKPVSDLIFDNNTERRLSVEDNRYANVKSDELEKIYGLEIALLEPQVRKDIKKLDRLIADNFYEIGASGKVYDKNNILARLPIEQNHEIYGKVINFEIAHISENLIRANYTLEEKTKRTRRTSIWQRQNNNYQMIFHQGTVLDGGGA